MCDHSILDILNQFLDKHENSMRVKRVRYYLAMKHIIYVYQEEKKSGKHYMINIRKVDYSQGVTIGDLIYSDELPDKSLSIRPMICFNDMCLRWVYSSDIIQRR